MTDGNGVLPKKNRGLLIAVGGGLLLAFLYILSRGKVTEDETGDGSGLAIQNVFNTIMKSLDDAVGALRAEFEPRVAGLEEAQAEQEAELSGLGEQVGTWQNLIDALTETVAGTQAQLTALQSEQEGIAAGLTASLHQQMVNIGKTMFLGMEEGTQNRARLNRIKRFVRNQMIAWEFPQEVIDDFMTWAAAHVEESATGKKATGGALGWFLSPFYDIPTPNLERSFDTPISGLSLGDYPVRARYGLQ